MEAVIIDDIRPQLPLDDLMKRLRMREDSPMLADLKDLIHQAEDVARPKAISGIAFIDDRGDDFVVVDGVRLTSRVLAVNLDGSNRLFPYLVTSGTEIEAWAARFDDVLQHFWAEAIREVIVRNAASAIDEYIKDVYGQDKVSRMSPGSLADWPLDEQKPLFQLLGETEQTIGVRLTDSMLMIPTKTTSGIRFETETSFESCMLCPRPSCPGRRAPQDPNLYESRYQKRAD